MITIKISDPQKLTPTHFSPMSAFVSFPYDPEIVDYIRELSPREYIPETREWEVPTTLVNKICERFYLQDIEITGTLVKNNVAGVKLPEGFLFKTTPFMHQVEGLVFGLETPCFLLGDEQGLGKTKQFIDLGIALKLLHGIKHCLVICGVNGNKYNWEGEVEIHSDEKAWVLGTRYTKRKGKPYEGSSEDKMYDLNHLPDAFFIITNIETLRALSYIEKGQEKKKNKKRTYPIADKINQLVKSGEIGLIGVDECQKAKNPFSQQGEALLSTRCMNATAMSGTPLMNSPMDLYVPLKWLGYENHNYYQYRNHYCRMGGYNNQDILGYKNLNELHGILDKMMIRRLKKDVLDLPPKMRITEYVDMYPDQQKLYKEIRQGLKHNVDKIKLSLNPLSEMIRLRQVTGYPGIMSSTITESAKLDRMIEMIGERIENNHKCVIFSQWTQMIDVIMKKLSAYNPACIIGEVKADDRMKEVKKFQTEDKCKIIAGTIGAMGTGLTLTAGSSVFFSDSPWNRALKDQAEDRAHRIGTTGTVEIITMVCKNTIDEIIENVIYSKGLLSDMIIDGGESKTSRLLSYAIDNGLLSEETTKEQIREMEEQFDAKGKEYLHSLIDAILGDD